MKTNRSYWESVLFDQDYDLIVTGAGITGLSAALFYKREHPDARVIVLDRGFYPLGASTRNAGFACFGTVGELLDDLTLESEEKVKERILERYKGLKLLRTVLGDENIDYEESGGYEIFPDSAKFNYASEHISRFNEWMEEIIGEREVYSETTCNGYHAIYNSCEGMLHPGKMIRRLLELNRQAGVEFRFQTLVSSIDPDQGSLTLSDEVVLYSENIITASNAFTSRLLPQVNIKPGRGYVFVTKKLEDLKWKGTFHYDRGYVYFRNIGDNRLLLGGGRNFDPETEETDEFGINADIKGFLLYLADELLMLPEGWEIEQEWSGIMGFTETKSAVLEKVSSHCVVAAGLSGMGVALGMQLGKSAAELIQG